MKLHALDLAVCGAYFVGILLFGVWVSRRQAQGGKEFFLGGENMRWPFIGASLFATNISSQQFVGQAGLAFTLGIIAGGFQWIGALAFALLAAVFLETYLGLRLTTSPEFFERRFILLDVDPRETRFSLDEIFRIGKNFAAFDNLLHPIRTKPGQSPLPNLIASS